MMRSAIAIFCLLISGSTVSAQQPSIQGPLQPYQGVVRESFADVVKKQAEMMRVSIGMNFMLAGIGDPIGDDAKLRDRTRRQVYQMAVKECELLLEMIASECRIENITINLNRNPQSQESLNVNATVALRAVQKQPAQ